MKRLKRIHVKSTRLNGSVYWGNMYPKQLVNSDLAKKAGVPTTTSDWDRHNYEATLPGFGVGDSMDWRKFIETLKEKGFSGPFEIENEAGLSKGTGNMAAIVQGCTATVLNLAPLLWPITEKGYAFDYSGLESLKDLGRKDIPLVTMDRLM